MSSPQITELTIPKPDDMHLHVRDGANLQSVMPVAAESFHTALIMPNLQPPVTTAKMAIEYKQRIMTAAGQVKDFTPLMTLYLTLTTTAQDIEEAAAVGVVALKLYPAGATTNSHQGVPIVAETIDETLQTLFPVFAAMVKHKLILCIHSEVTDHTIDIFDRESTFVSTFLPLVMIGFPELKVILEHITTSEAAELVSNYPKSIIDIVESNPKLQQSVNVLHDKYLADQSNTNQSFAQSLSLVPDRLGATITAHHLLVNRNAIFAGGLNPHYYCLPVLKSEQHRVAILNAATCQDSSINQRFFAGTDSAPHDSALKHSVGCAGCYTAYAATELYATAFQSINQLTMLEDFMCHRGRKFYNLSSNKLVSAEINQSVRPNLTLIYDEAGWTVPATYEFGTGKVVPFMAGKKLHWKIKGKQYPSQ